MRYRWFAASIALILLVSALSFGARSRRNIIKKVEAEEPEFAEFPDLTIPVSKQSRKLGTILLAELKKKNYELSSFGVTGYNALCTIESEGTEMGEVFLSVPSMEEGFKTRFSDKVPENIREFVGTYLVGIWGKLLGSGIEDGECYAVRTMKYYVIRFPDPENERQDSLRILASHQHEILRVSSYSEGELVWEQAFLRKPIGGMYYVSKLKSVSMENSRETEVVCQVEYAGQDGIPFLSLLTGKLLMVSGQESDLLPVTLRLKSVSFSKGVSE